MSDTPSQRPNGLNVAVFGGTEFTLGFELVGVRSVIHVDGLATAERIDKLFDTLKRADIGILIVDEQAIAGISAPDRYIMENYIRPVVIVLSNTVSDTSSLRRQIIRAIGVDVYTDQ